MIYPIVVYGHPVLRKVAKEIDKDYPELQTLIADMFETMYESIGVGLAAPQIKKSIRLVVIDADPYAPDYPEAKGFKKVFINPQIIKEEGEEWEFNEACLSLPGIAEYVMRKPKVTIKYLDEKFIEHEEVYDGMLARIIQHEYDHLEGVLFVDRVSNLKKILLKNKLGDMAKGKVTAKYKMIFAPIKRKRKK